MRLAYNCRFLSKFAKKIVTMIEMNRIDNLDEVIRFLKEPKKVFFDISWYGDAITYYRSKRLFLPKLCPKCHKDKPLIAVRVIMDNRRYMRPYITPVCKDCWNNHSRGMNLNTFIVSRFFLCPNINPCKPER